MSVACFCCSLPARPLGYKDGRGTGEILRRTAKPPAQPCSLTRRNKYRGYVVPTNSSVSPSPISSDGGIVFDLKDWLAIYQRVERFKGTSSSADPDFVEASSVDVPTVDGYRTSVKSKDVVIFPDTGVSVRLYLPRPHRCHDHRMLPILVYFHGGGFIIESIGSPHYHNFLNRVAADADVLIVSVNYRLAPEHFIPAAYDDCMAALNWVVSRSAGTGPESWLTDHGDFSQLFVAGDSAGGNITHYVAMRADAGVNIKGVALLHPYFFGKRPVGKEEDHPEDMLFHTKLWPFIAPDSDGLDDPRLNPFGPRAPSLNGLKCKRAIVFVAREDFHYYRGVMYYEALKKSGWKLKGNTAGLVDQEGVGHVYFLDDYVSDDCVEMMTKLVDFLKGDRVDFGYLRGDPVDSVDFAHLKADPGYLKVELGDPANLKSSRRRSPVTFKSF